MLRAFAEQNPLHPRADDALYNAGLGLMGLGEVEAAAGVFDRLTVRNPAGDMVVSALLKLAECRSRLNHRDDARALYTKVLLNYPGTPEANQAEQRLASMAR